MSGRRGELVVAVGLCLLLLVAMAYLTHKQGVDGGEDLGFSSSTYSSSSYGARVLYRWLEALDSYDVRRLEGGNFVLRPEDKVLWILSPPYQHEISSYDAEEIVQWVDAGGILIWSDIVANEHLMAELNVEYGYKSISSARPVVPWLVHQDAQYNTDFHFKPQAGTVPLLADEQGRAGAIRRRVGEGEVWLFASSRPFTNKGLREARNVALVEGVIQQFPPRTRITFDEYHHGFGGQNGMAALLREMRLVPWGWAFYYALGVFSIWVLLQGRSFGRPLALPGEHLRREAGEYVQSMAWLYRSARQRAPILRHYRERLKRRVMERYRLPPIEEDRAFVNAVARFLPDLDQAALHTHLKRLQKQQPSEKELIALARENDDWLRRLLDA